MNRLKQMKRPLLVMLVVFSITTASLSGMIAWRTQSTKAISFTGENCGASVPAFNADNYPALDMDSGVTQYYFGGNAFYGVGNGFTSDDTWELVDTDASVGGSTVKSVWGSGVLNMSFYYISCEELLNKANGMADKLPAVDQNAMKSTDVSCDTYTYISGPGGGCGIGSLAGAKMWPLSAKQFLIDGETPSMSTRSHITDLGKKLWDNIQESTWTRSYESLDNENHHFAWMNKTSKEINRENTNTSLKVLPAFALDLTKTLLVKDANSGVSSTPFGAYTKPGDTGDKKFLINAGSSKSLSSSLSGKFLNNVLPGKTYEIDYSGVNTGTINGGTNYVSAIIYDANGKIVSYGNLCAVSGEYGTASLTIPSNLSGNSYTIALFEEEKNGATATDYASAPVYAKFDVQAANYETDATISLLRDRSVQVGDTIASSDFKAKVAYLDGTTTDGNVYVLSSDDFNKTSDKRSITSTSVKVPKGSSQFKVMAVYIPQYTNRITDGYVAKEFTFQLNYEDTTAFQTSHDTSFNLNDTIKVSDFSAEITWIAGNKTNVSQDDLYILPAAVWDSCDKTKSAVTALTKYSGGKSIKIDDSELNGAQTYNITAIYFPATPGAEAYHIRTFSFTSTSLFAKGFEASYKGDKALKGSLLTDSDFSGKYILSDGDSTRVEANTKYVIPCDVWEALSEDVKTNENAVKRAKQVNAMVVPDVDTFRVMVVYYDYSEQHAHGGGIKADNCNVYAVEVGVPVKAEESTDYTSFTNNGITWHYKLSDGEAINLYTDNEDISQAIDSDGNFVIPEKVDGYTVKSIGTGEEGKPFVPKKADAFTGIKFPESMNQINDYAFYKNNAFMRLDIPTNITKIGKFAFCQCPNLSNVKTSSCAIGMSAFSNCTGLTELTVTGPGSIGGAAFAKCTALKKVSISGKVDIGKSAFADNSSISSLHLKGLTNASIDSYAFKNCTNIETLHIPNTNTVEAYAFDGCTGLKSLEADTDVVKNHSFERCGNIVTVIFGEHVGNVECNWGGYLAETYTDTDAMTGVQTDIYIKNKKTTFEAYKDGDEYYSAFMGHYAPSKSNKYARIITLHVTSAGDADTSDAVVNGTLVKAAYNKAVSGTYLTYYSANGLLSFGTVDTSKDLSDKTLDTAGVRDGITAYYKGSVYDNSKITKSEIVVTPTYTNASETEKCIEDFYFYDETEVEDAIAAWIAEGNNYTKKEVYQSRELFTTAAKDVLDNPAIQKVTSGESAIQDMKVIMYTADSDSDYHKGEPAYYTADLRVKVIKYTPGKEFSDGSYTYETAIKEIQSLKSEVAELTASVTDKESKIDAIKKEKEALDEQVDAITKEKTSLTSSVEALRKEKESLEDKQTELNATIKSLQEENAEDKKTLQTLEETKKTLEEQTKTLQSKIDTLEKQLAGGDDKYEAIEKEKESLAKQNASLQNELATCQKNYENLEAKYAEEVKQLKEYIALIETDDSGYLGTKKDENDTIIKIVWVNGRECPYEDKNESITINGKTYPVYQGTGKIDKDDVEKSFKFYVDKDGVHIIEINGVPLEKEIIYTDTERTQIKQLTNKLIEVQSELNNTKSSLDKMTSTVSNMEKLFNLDAYGKTEEERLTAIYNKVESLKKDYEALLAENKNTKEEFNTIIKILYPNGKAPEKDGKIDTAKVAQTIESIKSQENNATTIIQVSDGIYQSCSKYLDDVLQDKTLPSSINTQYKAMLDKVSALKDKAESLDKALESDETILAEIKKALKVKDNQDILASIGTLYSHIETLEAENAKSNQSVKEMKDALSKSKSAFTSLENQTERQIKALKAKNKSLTAKNKSLAKKNQTLSKNNQTLSSKNTSLAGKNAQLQKTVSALQEKIRGLMAKISLLGKQGSETEESNAKDSKERSLKRSTETAPNTKTNTETIIRTEESTPSPTPQLPSVREESDQKYTSPLYEETDEPVLQEKEDMLGAEDINDKESVTPTPVPKADEQSQDGNGSIIPKIIIVVIAGIVVILGGVWYYFNKKKTPED
jgi:FtsZ-binding cell division protein ZapB/predicted  nucleic acid-binding Zn-ribbon protein